MKISEYIKKLAAIQAEHGDLQIDTYGFDDSRQKASSPSIAYVLILKGKERKQRFWESYDGEEYKGDKVVRI